MGRLFWKFFFAYWIALLAAGAGVGIGVRLYERARTAPPPLLLADPRSAFLVDSAAATLRHGGEAALRELLADWQSQSPARVYVVDIGGNELMGRRVSQASLLRARALADGGTERSGTEGDGSEGSDAGRNGGAERNGDADRTGSTDRSGSTDRERDGTRSAPAVRRVTAAGGGSWLLYAPGDTEPAAAARPPRRPSPPTPALPIAAGVIASLAVSALLAWYVSRPIRHLRNAFAGLARGRLDTRVQALMGRRRDELASLGGDFDGMAQKLQTLIEAQRRLLHDVSHELRSPLARLQAAVGLARQSPARLEASLDRIERESARLDALVGELLTLSRLEAGTGGEPRQRVDLRELVEAIAEDARFEAQAAGRELAFAGGTETVAEVHAELLHRAFENVIRNAVKFTAPGSTVEVRLDRLHAPERMLLAVADRGPGVPAEDAEAIFEPFYRSESGVGVDGFGLGLTIARRAVQAHGGTIRARPREGGGLVMEIELPL